MLEIHGKKDCPFAWRVRLTARQKAVDFDWLPYDVPVPDPRTAEHNPERKSPLLWEDGFSLAESVIVAQYLDESREGRRLMPANATDLEGGQGGFDAQRQRTNGPCVLGDVFTNASIAARHGLREHAIPVMGGHRETVHLQLDNVPELVATRP